MAKMTRAIPRRPRRADTDQASQILPIIHNCSIVSISFNIKTLRYKLENANALGTSSKGNLPPKYRSVVCTIQLAVPAKVTDLQKYGYAGVLEPLIHDIHTLEKDGVFIDSIGQNVKGTILCIFC